MKHFTHIGYGLIGAVLLAGIVAACSPQPLSSDEKQRRAQESLSQEADNQVGMPAIKNFQEKRMAKMIFELRDTSIATYTYIFDNNGRPHWFCDSVGYGLPYSTQYTNPMRYLGQGATLPQPDPNGLFMPPQADGTWVMCIDPEDKKAKTVYVEPKVTTSPFKLKQAIYD